MPYYSDIRPKKQHTNKWKTYYLGTEPFVLRLYSLYRSLLICMLSSRDCWLGGRLTCCLDAAIAFSLIKLTAVPVALNWYKKEKTINKRWIHLHRSKLGQNNHAKDMKGKGIYCKRRKRLKGQLILCGIIWFNLQFGWTGSTTSK